MTEGCQRRRRATALAVVVGVLLGAVALVLGAAAPASAHATLVSTDPAEGAVLAGAPERITLEFSEGVTGVPDGAQVFDAEGAGLAATSSTSGKVLTVELTDPVGDGTLVVVWRVVSEDGHPISGSLTFSVGAPSDDVVRPDVEGTSAPEPPWGLTLVRWVGYAGLLVAVGLVAFLVLVLPAGEEGARRRLVGIARAVAGATAVAWLVALPLTSVYQLGGGLGSVLDGATWAQPSATEYVVTAAVVLGVLAAVGLAGSDAPVALVAAVPAAVAPALTGHTRATSPELVAVGADMLHLATGAVWLGGVVALALVLPALAERGTTAADVLARFSVLAAGSLAVLVAAGTLLAWRILGSWSALVETRYGQLLLLKIAAVLVVVGLAAWNRYRLVPALRAASRKRERKAGVRPLTRAIAVEAAVLAVVLLVTGRLVDRSPEAEASIAAAAEVGTATAALGPAEVEVRLSPLAPGPATVSLVMRDDAGEPFEGFAAPTVSMASGDVDLGALDARSVAPGRYAADVVLPTAGTWTVQVSLRVDEFTNPVAEVEIDVPDRAG